MSDNHFGNDAHSPDIEHDEHVFTPPEEQTQPSSPKQLSIADADRKFDGYSKSASDCLHKTYRLALELNHGTVCAAHLILAMTLIPNASKQFELRKVDINKAYQAAMSALTALERGSPNGHAARSSSEELNNIISLAREFASNRDNQDVSVDDLLTALDRLPADSSAAQLIRGGRTNEPAYVLKEAFEQFATALGQRVDDMMRQAQFASVDASAAREATTREMFELRTSLQDALAREMSELRAYLQSREENTERQIEAQLSDIKAALAAMKTSEPETPLDTIVNGGASKPSNWLTDIFNGKPEQRPT